MTTNANSQAHHKLLRAAIVGLVLLSANVLPTSSFALGTEQQRAACTNDVMRLCFSAALTGDDAIVSCMKQNYSSLSDRCKKTLPPL